MRKLLNALYVLTPESYLSLDGENVRVTQKGEETGRFPLHILQQISSFSYAGASPALMGKCTEMGIQLSFFTPNGRFLAQVQGAPRGNVLLRRRQYRTADDTEESLLISRNMVFGKVYNQSLTSRVIHQVIMKLDLHFQVNLNMKKWILKV